MTMLRSRYLLDIKAYFEAHRGALSSSGRLEFEEEAASTIMEELWEVILWLVSDVYLVLTVWGDRRASFVVRENTRKRRYKLLLGVRDFPLLASPAQVFELFKDAAARMFSLSTPPGGDSDGRLLAELRERWLALSKDELH